MLELAVFIKLAFLFPFLSWAPGYVFARRLGITFSGSRAAFFFLPFVFGIPLTSIAYLLARLAGFSVEILILPIAMWAICFWEWLRHEFPKFTTKLTRSDLKTAVIFLLLCGIVIGLGFSYSSRTYFDNEGGYVIGDGAFSDNIWSISVSAELKHHVPPRLPLLSGYRLRYHYLGDLFTELLYRLCRTPMNMLDFNFRYEPPFFILLFLGVLYLSLKEAFKRPSIALLSIALLTLAPLRTPLFFKHHSTLALIYFYAATFYFFSVYFRDTQRNRGYLYAGFFLVGLLPIYDAAFGAVANGTLLVYALIEAFRERKFTPFLKACLLGGAFGAMVYITALGWPGGHAGSLLIGKGPQMAVSRERFKWITVVLKFILNSIPGSQSLIGHLSVEIVKGCYHTFFLILSLFFPPKDAPLKYHFLAIPLFFSILRHRERFNRAWNIAAWVAAACILFSVFVTYKRGPAISVTLRAIEFAQLALIPFTALAIHSFFTRRSWKGITLTAVAFLLYVLPGFIRYQGYVKSYFYSYVDKDTLEVFNFLKDKTPVSSVVLHPFHDNPVYRVGEPPVKPAWMFGGHYYFLSALGERQAVFEGAATSTTYYMGDASHEQVVARMQEVDQFYVTADTGWAESFLDRYGVNFVWVPRDKSLQFKSPRLVPILENPRHVLLEVKRGFS